MEYRILGHLEVVANGAAIPLGPPKQRALLAALLLRANHPVPTDWLVDCLWGESPPRTAAHALQTYVSALRKVLDQPRGQGAGVLVGRSQSYELRVAPDELDALRFERLLSEAEAALEEGRTRDAERLLTTALGLWRGRPLADLADELFAMADIHRLEELRLLAVERWGDASLKLGRHAQLVPELRRSTKLYPLRERLWAQLIEALNGSGRQAEALDAYRELGSILGEELGIEPSSELRRLEERVLLQDPELLVPPETTDAGAARAPPRNPYKGLQAFSEEDAADFFGRDLLVGQLLERLKKSKSQLLAVVGPSGCGKSSVVTAGLIPALRIGAVGGPGAWTIAHMLPGTHPFAELEAALLRVAPDSPLKLDELFTDDDLGLLRAVLRLRTDNRRLLLVIDQFEELFTLVESEEVRRRFLNNLAKAVRDPYSRLTVVVALRADFYDRPLRYPDFGSLLSAAVVNALPLTVTEHQEAAIQPAAGEGVVVEPALMAELVADVSHDPGSLPLFQYALTELFDERDGQTLTLDAYRAIGGLRGALTRRAEELYGSLDAARQEGARQVFLRMVAIGETRSDARRRVPTAELVSLGVDPETIRAVLDVFGRHRLLSFDRNPVTNEPTVEVAHEALLGEWGRLRDWIDANRDSLRRHTSFASAVDEWFLSDRDPDFLLRGSRLEYYEEWRAATTMALTAPERAFLDESRELRDRELAAEEMGTRRRRRIRRRVLLAVLAVVTGVAGWLTVAAVMPAGEEVAAVTFAVGDERAGDLIVTGLERAAREFDLRSEVVVTPVVDAEGIRALAEAGFDPIIGMYGFGEAIKEVSAEFPETTFVVIEGGASTQNVARFWFASQEGAYLMGAIAAMMTETGVIGYVGSSPLYGAGLYAGFEAGALATDPTVKVVATYVHWGLDMDASFLSPSGGRRAAALLYGMGADILFHDAGQSGQGVLDAARALSTPERHLWMIGIDRDEYLAASPEQRGHVLTSMIKRYDLVTYEAIRNLVEEGFVLGEHQYGFAEGGIEYSTSGGYIDAITAELDRLRAGIISGTVAVPTNDYSGGSAFVGRPEATSTGTLIFDGAACRFDGPTSMESGDVLEVYFENSSGSGAGASVGTVAEGTTREEVEEAYAQRGHNSAVVRALAPRDFLGPFALATVGSGDTATVTVELSEGTWRVVCGTGPDPAPAYLGGLIEVSGG